MGIEPFLVAASLNLVVAQRLVRKICTKCKSAVDVHPEGLAELGIPVAEGKALTFYKGRGCSVCNGTGYSGRQGLFEVMPITPEVRSMILDRTANDKIKKKAMEQGMLTLRQDAVLKLRAGITTIEEVLRETAKD
jgi:type IV pilus assembly protein PilB